MSRSSLRLAITVADLTCIAGALTCARAWSDVPLPSGIGQLATETAVFTVVWLLIARRLGAYSIAPGQNLVQSLRRTLESWAATWGLAGLIVTTALDAAALDVWITLAAGAALLALSRSALSFGEFGATTSRPRAIVVGACPSARALTSTPGSTEAVEVVGFVPFSHEDPADMPHLSMLGKMADLTETLRRNELDMAIVSPSDAAVTGEVNKAIDTCERLGLHTHYFPAFLDTDHLHVGLTWSANRPGLNVHAAEQPSLRQAVKRTIDILGAGAGILLLLPVFVACALAVKLSSAGPVFFRQVRVGQSGRTFSCLKFRTMRVGAHAQLAQLKGKNIQDGPAFKMTSDPRVTPAGRILRKFSLDELPQLINVLFGDMSLVGPRPPIPSEVEQYAWWQRRRISVKPGLTCIWQVYGRNRVSFKRWVEMDLYYIDNWSLWLDLKLILHTIRVVIRGTGM